MSINKAIVVGNLGRDPKIRALPSGQNVANFSVATKARFKGIETASSRNARNGIESLLSESSRITASARFRRDARSTSRGGCEPASTRKGTAVASAIRPRS